MRTFGDLTFGDIPENLAVRDFDAWLTEWVEDDALPESGSTP